MLPYESLLGTRWQFDPLAVEILQAWVTSNGIDEYPSAEVKKELSDVTGIGYDQISKYVYMRYHTTVSSSIQCRSVCMCVYLCDFGHA